VVIEFGRFLAEMLGDLLGRAGLADKGAEDAEPERIGEHADLRQVEQGVLGAGFRCHAR
jgi:hypothetical protein